MENNSSEEPMIKLYVENTDEYIELPLDFFVHICMLAEERNLTVSEFLKIVVRDYAKEKLGIDVDLLLDLHNKYHSQDNGNSDDRQ